MNMKRRQRREKKPQQSRLTSALTIRGTTREIDKETEKGYTTMDRSINTTIIMSLFSVRVSLSYIHILPSFFHYYCYKLNIVVIGLSSSSVLY